MLESKNLNDKQLKDYAEQHLQYEYDMLLWSSRILGFFRVEPIGGIPHTVHDALLNNFSMHSRNLLGFLYDGPRNALRSNSVSIENYIDKTTIDEIRPPISDSIDLVFIKANKQVAHLTTERIEFEASIDDKAWRFVDILKEIMNLLSIIIPHIPDGRISNSLKTKLSNTTIKSPLIQVSLLVNEIKDNNVVGLKILMNPEIQVKIK